MSLIEDEIAQLRIATADVVGGYPALQPPKRTSVSAGAAAILVIKQPGGYAGPWDASETPYMVEPMNMLASRQHEALAFVGPARTGKTAALLLGWMAHTIVNDPGDMLFIQMSQDKAREFSKTDVGRAIRNSPAITDMLSGSAADMNTHDVMFKHGMWLRIAWPTVSNVSGSTYRYVAITDLDRIANADNVDGEGPLFDLAKKRTQTFLSRGMCLAESSPGIELTDPNWRAATRHEAPPVGGIVGIYNRSDRRRWYWQCPDCHEHFEAAQGLELFGLPNDDLLLETIRSADIEGMAEHYGRRIICPHCGVEIPASEKTRLNRTGRWLADGLTIDDEGNVHGTALNSTIVGYWLGGVAATYQSWKSLISRYLQGLKEYALTGSEETLKTTVNTDQGIPYMSRHLMEAKASQTRSPQERAEGKMQRYVVPGQTRTLVAAVDVQGGSTSRFIVQVHAVGPFREQWLVDRFEIKLSAREGMGAEFAPIDPAAYPEDWDQLTKKLLLSTYQTPDEGREIRVKMLTVDTGGEDGVTANAYAWYRRVKKLGLHKRVMLYKGASSPTAPVLKETLVGKIGNSKPDIPLCSCNPNLLSDIVASGLKRDGAGAGYLHFPEARHPETNPGGWLPQAFFDELGAEVRGKNGRWSQIRKRNETFDLCRMIAAGIIRLGLDKITDWNKVPAWLAPLDRNEDVISADDRRTLKASGEEEIQADAVISVAPIKRAPRQRRVVQSGYLG
jgi:phage terminase large subunit GpA-like protein